MSEDESSSRQYLVHPIQQKDSVRRLTERYQALDERFGDVIASYSLEKPSKRIHHDEDKLKQFPHGIPVKFYDRVRLRTLLRPMKFEPLDYETQRDLLIQSYLS